MAKIQTYEEWWMSLVQIGPGFEGLRTFENCSRYFNLSDSRTAWEACEKQYQEKVAELEAKIKKLEG